MSAQEQLSLADNQDLVFDSLAQAQNFCGVHDQNLVWVESRFGVQLFAKGNLLRIKGDAQDKQAASAFIQALLPLAEQRALASEDLLAHMRIESNKALDGDEAEYSGSNKAGAQNQAERLVWKVWSKSLASRTAAQAEYMRLLQENTLVFGLGPAGTGKTFLAVARAVQLLFNSQIERIIITRPAVEAGEKLGYLPGDFKEKVDPYMRPIYDALHELTSKRETERLLEQGILEIAPLAFMRGRTLKRSFIILDEAQNTTIMQMKMFLTRLGEGSSMVVNGDLGQIDLPAHQRSGLRDASQRLHNIEQIAMMRFSNKDVIRHALVGR